MHIISTLILVLTCRNKVLLESDMDSTRKKKKYIEREGAKCKQVKTLEVEFQNVEISGGYW